MEENQTMLSTTMMKNYTADFYPTIGKMSSLVNCIASTATRSTSSVKHFFLQLQYERKKQHISKEQLLLQVYNTSHPKGNGTPIVMSHGPNNELTNASKNQKHTEHLNRCDFILSISLQKKQLFY